PSSTSAIKLSIAPRADAIRRSTSPHSASVASARPRASTCPRIRATRCANRFFFRIGCDMIMSIATGAIVYTGRDYRIFLGVHGRFGVDSHVCVLDNGEDVGRQLVPIGSSVGEAPASHTGHCPPASREAGRGRTGTPESRVFLMWLGRTDLHGA